MGNRRRKGSTRNSHQPRNPVKSNHRTVWWKQPVVQVLTLVGAPVIAGLSGAWLLWAAGPTQTSSSATGNSSATNRPVGNPSTPVIIEDIQPSPLDYASFVAPKKLILSKSQLAALESTHANAGFGAIPSGDAIVNQEWITLTVAGNSSAPITINNIGIVKHCQAPLAWGATLFYALLALGI